VIFVDASVLIATAQLNHERHVPSRELWNWCTLEMASVSAYAISDLYNTLTAMPPSLRLAPRNALLVLETYLQRLTPVTLTAEECVETLRSTANLGHSGATIYDALHLACARKVGAKQIYTWNPGHFRRIAPDLAERIMTP
jgi:predicted nucleic acid-binding protein